MQPTRKRRPRSTRSSKRQSGMQGHANVNTRYYRSSQVVQVEQAVQVDQEKQETQVPFRAVYFPWPLNTDDNETEYHSDIDCQTDTECRTDKECLPDREYQANKECLPDTEYLPEENNGPTADDIARAWNEERYDDIPLDDEFVLSAEGVDKYSRTTGENPLPPGWKFAQILRARPEFDGLTGDEIVEQIDWTITEFTEDQIYDISDYLDEVKIKAGEHPLRAALRLAIEAPIINSQFQIYTTFVSLAYHLHCIRRGKEIFLPQKILAAVLEVAGGTVSRLIKRARKDGYLVLVKPSPNRKLAATYRFNIEKFPALTEDQ